MRARPPALALRIEQTPLGPQEQAWHGDWPPPERVIVGFDRSGHVCWCRSIDGSSPSDVRAGQLAGLVVYKLDAAYEVEKRGRRAAHEQGRVVRRVGSYKREVLR